MDRRTLLFGMGAAAAAALAPRVALASAETDARLVLVVLRGGLDGLAAVPAHGDPHHREARGSAAVTEGVVDLDGTFGLHPALAPTKALWDARELLVVHATSAPYRDRSHFDGQNVLENGTARPYGLDTGWLNRALVALGGAPPAMALGRQVPLVLQGPARATCADPFHAPVRDESFLDRVRDLYAGDALLGPALEEGIATRAMLSAHRDGTSSSGGRRGGEPEEATRVLARVMAAPDGPRVAVVELSGWDTHAAQEGTLDKLLGQLGRAVLAYRDAAGESWSKTAVLAVTEFGRRVKGNGTGGSDHGVGGAALLAGGAVRGRRVVADWPGLAASDLYEGRDLRSTTDLRTVFAGVLRDHLGVPEGALANDVFPGGDVAPLDGLVRG